MRHLRVYLAAISGLALLALVVGNSYALDIHLGRHGDRYSVPPQDYNPGHNYPPPVYNAPQPPPPYPENVPPAPGNNYVWIGGHWEWNGGQYNWTQGYWTIPPAGTHWVPPQYPPGRYIPGFWEPNR
ncbi:MAG: hypothetical protein LLG01_19175 [Planctomycetaceae bacterium]|nr:hypothetical protein [Planctomycetaceae bacterium]